MKTIGIIVTALGTAAAVFAAVLAARALPDIKRYLKIRAM